MTGPVELNPLEQDELLKAITVLLLHSVPADWRQVQVEYRAVGHHVEVSVLVFATGGRLIPWQPPEEAAGLFARLRAGMRREGGGTWFTARFRLDYPDEYSVEYDYDAQPRWESRPPARAVEDELRLFPRNGDHQLPWLRRETKPLRQAEVFDGTDERGAPAVNRPAVPYDEVQRLLDYLEQAPVVLSARGFGPDAFDPGRPAQVPLAFHTDGHWIWPGAAAYYLRLYGVPPQPGLVEHARANGFCLSEVDQLAKDAALAVVTGRPVEPVAAAPSRQELAEQASGATVRAALREAADAAEELGIDPRRYRIGERADDAWCLMPDGKGWRVFWSEGADATGLMFAEVGDAVTHFVGHLYLNKDAYRGTGT